MIYAILVSSVQRTELPKNTIVVKNSSNTYKFTSRSKLINRSFLVCLMH